MLTSMPFAPKRPDGRALWRILFDHITDLLDEGRLKIGDLIPHENLRALLESDEQGSYLSAVSRASNHLREERQVSLVAVRGKGYQLISGIAQADQGALYKRKGLRSFKRGLAIIESTDLSRLSSGERNTVDGMRRGMAVLAAAAAASWERLNRHEEDLAFLKKDSVAKDRALAQKASAEEVEELRRRVEEMERQKE